MGAPIGVLALQGDVREHSRALEAAGALPQPVTAAAHLAGIRGLIIPGGESTTIGKLLVAFDLLEPVRAAVRSGLPVYGSCAGMILLAESVLDGIADQVTIGGLDIVVRRNAFGRQVDSFEQSIAVTGIGPDVPAVFIRAPWVESVGPDVDILARASGAGNPVAVRQGPVLATSFHPELTGDIRMHTLFLSIVEEEV